MHCEAAKFDDLCDSNYKRIARLVGNFTKKAKPALQSGRLVDPGLKTTLTLSFALNPHLAKENKMSISHTDIGDDFRRILITGRLDLPGTDSVAKDLEALTSEPKKAVVIDLSGLRFLASIGISTLIVSARAVHARGGKVALVVQNNSTVKMSLEATGVDELIPIFDNLADAEKSARA